MVGGVELVTGADVRERWGDVGAARLRDWCRTTRYREPLLHPVTVGELAALSGHPVPAGRDPRSPARAPGKHGPGQNLYRWADVVEVEHQVAEQAPEARRSAR